MIKLTKINKTFSGFQALSDVSFQVKPGTITAFLGVNGAGKTTTMRIIDGIIKPDSGRVLVNGLSPQKDKIEVKKSIGYLPENNPLYLSLRVSEYLNFVSQVRGLAGFPAKFSSLFKQMGIISVWDQKIETLSRGYRQRVGLTVALIHQPKILVLDEPLSGLDPVQKEEIMHLLKNISRRTTILFSTHILPEVEELCNRVIIIHQGRILFSGWLKDMKRTGYNLRLSYQGSKKLIAKIKKSKPELELDSLKKLKRNQWQVKFNLDKKLNPDDYLKSLSLIVSQNGGLILGLQKSKEDLASLFYQLTKTKNEN